jgi:beta-mannosidase
MTRKDKKTFPDELSASKFVIDTVLEIWGTNNTLQEKKTKLDVTFFDLHSDWTQNWSKDVTLAANSSTELYSGELEGVPQRTKLSEVSKTVIVSARLLDADGTVLGRYANW